MSFPLSDDIISLSGCLNLNHIILQTYPHNPQAAGLWGIYHGI